MSWADDFKAAAAEGRNKPNKVADWNKKVTEQVTAFFHRLLERSGFDPKRTAYVEMRNDGSGEVIPYPIDKATPSPRAVDFDTGSGETLLTMTVQLEVPDDTIKWFPIWVHVLFRASADGDSVRASCAGATALIPKDADALLDHIQAVVKKKLAEGAVHPPVNVK